MESVERWRLVGLNGWNADDLLAICGRFAGVLRAFLDDSFDASNKI